MAAETPTGFLIEGKVYELPTLDSLTTDEGEVLYDRSGLVQEDFVPEVDEADEEHEARIGALMRHPGFMAALMHIAYQRGNPTVKAAQVKLVIGKTNRLEALSGLMGTEEELADESPLELTSEPNGSSSSGSLENVPSTLASSVTSGSDSGSGSVRPDAQPAPTGITRSVTSSISAQEISAA